MIFLSVIHLGSDKTREVPQPRELPDSMAALNVPPSAAAANSGTAATQQSMDSRQELSELGIVDN